ncbi:ATP-binding cassette domain-containing protein [Brevibacterium sp. UCMA 11754]|uniref:ATP-binding cassette domain-containing protein n=1 Tax=Brevibacterium sp. UCMA 11754 TaxID=2749198 RepID=UPI002286701F|nr:ATP-binding cassette domain-containing protein [Brevibacterium sp. UCMA 11754]MCF2571004.1 ATP-binding cassette domain-containing protein [Brevibacterium sp. UCMA 11754]
MGLVGESGSGKSMTLRTILGMLPPAATVVEGEVRFRGRKHPEDVPPPESDFPFDDSGRRRQHPENRAQGHRLP